MNRSPDHPPELLEAAELYRDCVVRERHLDLMGRPLYAALDVNGCELDRMVAVSPEETRRVITHLWEVVHRARDRDRHLQLLP